MAMSRSDMQLADTPPSKMERYLFVGGQYHGQYMEVDASVSTVKTFESPPLQYRDGLPMLGGPPVPVTYHKARLGGAPPGKEPKFKDVYIHESLSEDDAMPALSSALMERWLNE